MLSFGVQNVKKKDRYYIDFKKNKTLWLNTTSLG